MRNQILHLIALEANISSSNIVLDNTLEEDLGLDSLNMVGLQLAIEDELDIFLDDTDWQRVRTVQDVITFAASKLATH